MLGAGTCDGDGELHRDLVAVIVAYEGEQLSLLYTHIISYLDQQQGLRVSCTL